MMNQDLVYTLWAECVAKHTRTPMNWQLAADEFAQLCYQHGYITGYQEAKADYKQGYLEGYEDAKEHSFGLPEPKHTPPMPKKKEEKKLDLGKYAGTYGGYTVDPNIQDPCPGCMRGGVCRTIACGRLKLPLDHPLRTGK